MSKQYPRSVLTGNAAEAFRTVYDFHRGRRRGNTLDPTCGERLWWGDQPPDSPQPPIQPRRPDVPDHVLCSDAIEFPGCEEQSLFSIKELRPEWEGAFSMVVYDPPYFVNVNRSKDPRENQYGGYSMTEGRLLDYMRWTATTAPWLLNKNGKIIVKCADQYIVKDRRLRLWHTNWIQHIHHSFDIVDLFVYPYHRVSPTAYQVKDRPSSIIAHTYLIVGQKR